MNRMAPDRINPPDTFDPLQLAQELFGPQRVTEITDVSSCQQSIIHTIRTLNAAEEHVIIKRFLQSPPLTLRAIGETLGVSRSRILQIQGRALRKLRHPSRGDRIKPFLHLVF